MESGQGSAPDGEQPAPGWYPDPMDSTGLRYWDGKRWTVEEAPTGSGPSAPRGGSAVQRPPRALVSAAWPTVAVLLLCGLINVALLAAGLRYSDHVNAALTSDGPSLSEADAAKDSLVLINGIITFSILVAAIVFLVWFHRAYSNAAGLADGRLRWGTGWSVGAWFVPILWWWRPKQIANDIWRAGDPKAKGNPNWNSLPVAGIVHWWWALYLLGGLVGGVGGAMLSPDPVLFEHLEGSGDVTTSDLELERAAATVLAASGALMVIAVAAAVTFVLQASRRQDERISGGAG